MILRGMAQDPMCRDYIAGKLALAGLGLSTPFNVWLDAVYAAWADAPHALLKSAMREIVVEEAKLDPERARADWGLRPEHQALTNGLGRHGGYGEQDKIPRLPNGARRRQE